MCVEPLESTLVHARADHCSRPVLDGGQQVVRFEGSTYVMVGIYFARVHGIGARQNGERELYYILRKRVLPQPGAAGRDE